MVERRRPGLVRDAIFEVFRSEKRELKVGEIVELVNKRLGENIPPSSVRSYLGENVGTAFERTGHGCYRLIRK